MLQEALFFVVKVIVFYVGWFLICKLSYVLRGIQVGRIHQRTFRDGRTFTAVEGDLTVALVHKEIYCDDCYFSHGVSLEGRKNPLILDVGGNCGLVSAWVGEHYPTATIHIFEPVPTLVECARRNLAKFGVFVIDDPSNAPVKSPAGSRMILHKVALGEKESKVSFTFEPMTTAGSSLNAESIVKAPKDLEMIAALRAMLYDAVDGESLPRFPTRLICALLNIPYLRVPVFIAIIPLLVMLFLYYAAAGAKKDTFNCTVRPLSAILEEQGLTGKKIDFIKIDVEGGEWDVLKGLSDENWRCIDQMVIEVHDGNDGRIAKVHTILKNRGFKNIVEVDDDLQLHRIFKVSIIYATR